MLDPIFETFRKFLAGYKTYLTAIAGLVAALLSFANGEIEMAELIAAITASTGLASLRAGVKTAVADIQEKLNDAADSVLGE